MQWKTLDSAPSLPPLYWRAALKRKITGRTLPGARVVVTISPLVREAIAPELPL